MGLRDRFNKDDASIQLADAPIEEHDGGTEVMATVEEDKPVTKKSRRMFGRKNKEKGGEPTPSRSGGKRKRRNDSLLSVLSETVMDHATTVMSENENFIAQRDGESVYIGLMLDTDNEHIGGLSRRSNRDPNKGAIIECINNGRIQVILTSRLAEENKIVIIPTSETLKAAGEFSQLVDSPYQFVSVNTIGDHIEAAGNWDVTFEDLEMLANGNVDINDMLVDHNVPWAHRSDEDMIFDGGLDVPDTISTNDAIASSVAAAVKDRSMDLPEIGEIEDEPFEPEDAQSKYEPPMLDEEAFESLDDDAFGEDEDDGFSASPVTDDYVDEPVMAQQQMNQPIFNPMSASEVAQQQQVEVIEFDRDAMDAVYQQSFFSDDLGIRINYDRFDSMFNRPVTLLPEDYGVDWLDEQVGAIARNANVDLQRVHAQNMETLRNRYTRVLSGFVDEIVRTLDINTGADTPFAERMRELQERAYGKYGMEAMDSIVADRRAAEEARWHSAYEQEGQAARAQAISNYQTRYSNDHQARLDAIPAEVRASFDSAYENNKAQLMEARRSEATRMMDFGVSSVLKDLLEMYNEMMADEGELFNSYQQEIYKYIDDHRQDDMSYAMALANREDYEHALAQQREDFENKMRQSAFEIEEMRKRNESDLDEIRARNKERLDTIEASWEHRLEEEKARNEQLRQRHDDLLDKYADLDDAKDREYRSRIRGLQEELRISNDRAESVEKAHKAVLTRTQAAAIIGLVTAFCIGMLFGLNQTIDYSSASSVIMFM